MSQTTAPPDIAGLAARAHSKLEAGAFITCAELGAILGLDKATVSRLASGPRPRYPSQQPTGPGGARRFSPGDVATIRAEIASPAVSA